MRERLAHRRVAEDAEARRETQWSKVLREPLRLGGEGFRAWGAGSATIAVSMDFERTIEHLLGLHARAEARMEKAEARMDRSEARLDRVDKQLQATARLVRAGIKIVADIGKAQRETDQKLKALIQAQARTDEQLARTDEKFERLIKALLRRSGNGRG